MQSPIIILVIDNAGSVCKSLITDVATILLLVEGVLPAFLIMFIYVCKRLLKSFISLTQMNVHSPS